MKNSGFTLIELMIVVAIIGIMASLAMASYDDAKSSSRRTVAQGGLEELAMAMEHYAVEHNSNYNDPADPSVDTNGAPLIFPALHPSSGRGPYYRFWILNVSRTAYTLVAEPIESQTGDGILMLRSNGLRGWDEDNSLNGNINNFGHLSPTELDWDKG